ncbi:MULTISPECIES: hypothetical protein [Cysteiniphilum]|uniref:hypothetical protein n=1 Tax=Cysteiniphilum TaxID=2056696 RepID=UPI001784F88F|nr:MULTISPECIES: hypothetical protein [Cysteiniphilum]
MKSILICILPFILCSCAIFTDKYTYKNPNPKALTENIKCLKEGVSFSPPPTKDILVSNIGDSMFVSSRYIIMQQRKINTQNLRNGFGSPNPSDWSDTYIYDDGDIKSLVFTSPSFYAGIIGVIANTEGKFMTKEPFVAVKGSKKGWRWEKPSNSSDHFFSIIENTITVQQWRVRYSGLKNNNLHIQIIPLIGKTSEKDVIHDIYITKQQFMQGFSLKEIFIKGISINKDASITYTVKNIKNYFPCNRDP